MDGWKYSSTHSLSQHHRGLSDQLCASAVSIPAPVDEGVEWATRQIKLSIVMWNECRYHACLSVRLLISIAALPKM